MRSYSLVCVSMITAGALAIVGCKSNSGAALDAGGSADSQVGNDHDAQTAVLPDSGVTADLGTAGSDAGHGFNPDTCDPSYYTELPTSQRFVPNSGGSAVPLCSYATRTAVLGCSPASDMQSIITCEGSQIAADATPAVSGMDTATNTPVNANCATCIQYNFDACMRLAGFGRLEGDLNCCVTTLCSTGTSSEQQACAQHNCPIQVAAFSAALRTSMAAANCLLDENSAYLECYATSP